MLLIYYLQNLKVFILTYITIDRYLAIVFPLRLKRDFKGTVSIILIIWFVCFLIASIPVFKLNYFDHFYGKYRITGFSLYFLLHSLALVQIKKKNYIIIFDTFCSHNFVCSLSNW